MAISLKTEPNTKQSGYNPIVWVIDSTNKALPGFRYIVQIFDAGTSNLLVEMDIAPDVTNNSYGVVDVSRIVRNKVDKSLDLTNNDIRNAVETFYRYDVKFGESYSSDWSFTDYGLNTTFGIYTGLFQSPQVTPHTFVVGDQVYVETNSVYTDNRKILTGYFTVVGVVNAYDFVINLSGVGSFPATPGKVRYADNRKVRVLNLLIKSSNIIVNTAMDHLEFSSTLGSLSTYEITTSSTTKKFLTNVPSEFSVTPEQHLWINMFEFDNGTTQGKDIRVTNSNGDTFNINNSGSFYVKQNGVGPANFGTYSVVSGTAPIIKGDTEWYEIKLINNSGVTVSESKKFIIDRRCVINDIEIVFMDRKGSFMSYAFPLRMFEGIEINKSKYNTKTDVSSLSAEGVRVYHSEFIKVFTLNTNFMSDAMNLYFEELLTSPYTYIRYEGEFYSCKVETSGDETERGRNRRLLKRQISVVFDINTPINI